jgi:hypothetical protein
MGAHVATPVVESIATATVLWTATGAVPRKDHATTANDRPSLLLPGPCGERRQGPIALCTLPPWIVARGIHNMRKCQFAVNPETHQLYERVPDNQWKEKLSAWGNCRRSLKCHCHIPAVPCPMPYGHVMFEVKKSNHYRPVAVLPTPIWTDGIGCIFAGQRVGWEVKREGTIGEWFWGEALRMEADGTLTVRLWHGGVCGKDPLALA